MATATAEAHSPISFEKFVLEQSAALRTVMKEEVSGRRGQKMLEDFATGLEERIRRSSHETQQFIMDHFKDDKAAQERALTRHADHVRSLTATMVLFRDGYVPAIKIRSTDIVGSMHWKLQALEHLLYLKAGCDAMENLIL